MKILFGKMSLAIGLLVLLSGGELARAEDSLPLSSALGCTPDSFTIVGVPDSQGNRPRDDQLVESFRVVLEQKALWDATSGTKGCNVVFVTGYGDVVETIYGSYGVAQMKHMSRVYSALQDKSLGIPGDPQVPYHVANGNHDSWKAYGDNAFHFKPPGRDPQYVATFLEYFPASRFVPPGRGGWNEEPLTFHYRQTQEESIGSVGVNSWQIVSTNLEVDGKPLELLHLGLEWGWFTPGAKVLEWAADRVREHPGLPAFITTHLSLKVAAVKPDRCGSNFGAKGPHLFRDLMNQQPSIFAAMNGHAIRYMGAAPECHVAMRNRHGLDTVQLYNNYQELGPEGERGLGYLVYMTYDLPEKKLHVRVHSARHGFRDARRSNGKPASSLDLDFDLLRTVERIRRDAPSLVPAPAPAPAPGAGTAPTATPPTRATSLKRDEGP